MIVRRRWEELAPVERDRRSRNEVLLSLAYGIVVGSVVILLATLLAYAMIIAKGAFSWYYTG